VPVQIFTDQVTTDVYVMEMFYIIATAGSMIAILAIALMDAGLASPKNLIDTFVQKLLCALIGGLAFMFFGYAVWNWQFYQALGIPDAFTAAVKDWGLLGNNMMTLGPRLDPAAVAQADFQQLFALFFFAFGGILTSFMHSAGLERLKPLPALIMAALGGGVFLPLMTYLTWGSASPLTNAGLHDFVGAFSLYIFVGLWSLILSWRLGPRRHNSGVPGSFALLGAGTFVLIVAIPLFVIGCGYLVPGKGYYGVTYAESGLGILFTNIFMSLGGGALTGALLAYRLRKPAYALLGPIAGYISCTALFDIALPWQALVISLVGPFLLHAGVKLTAGLGIDDPKVAPLALGPGIYSVVMAGVIGAGKPAGGMLGVTQGPFAFQHAHISLGMQLQGLAILVPTIAVVAFAVIVTLDKTLGLRVTAAQEDIGLDATYWLPKSVIATEPSRLPDNLTDTLLTDTLETRDGIQRAN
jgi:ammonia channel protein AmtB